MKMKMNKMKEIIKLDSGELSLLQEQDPHILKVLVEYAERQNAYPRSVEEFLHQERGLEVRFCTDQHGEDGNLPLGIRPTELFKRVQEVMEK